MGAVGAGPLHDRALVGPPVHGCAGVVPGADRPAQEPDGAGGRQAAHRLAAEVVDDLRLRRRHVDDDLRLEDVLVIDVARRGGVAPQKGDRAAGFRRRGVELVSQLEPRDERRDQLASGRLEVADVRGARTKVGPVT